MQQSPAKIKQSLSANDIAFFTESETEKLLRNPVRAKAYPSRPTAIANIPINAVTVIPRIERALAPIISIAGL